MNGAYRVVWPRRLVEHALANFVVAAMQSGQGAADITLAMNEIDRLLAANPQEEGESRDEFERIIIVPPLSVDYEVQEDERIVLILRARYVPRRPAAG